MKVLVLCGSPHKNGTTNALADAFIEGVGSEHTVEKVHVAKMKITPCLGCNYCKNNNDTCVHKDDMVDLAEQILAANVLVFVSPLYYFSFTAQLKAVIDRFYMVNKKLIAQKKKCILLSAGADKDDWAMDGIRATYATMLRYLGWTSLGDVCALASGTKEALAETGYPEMAKVLGRSL